MTTAATAGATSENAGKTTDTALGGDAAAATSAAAAKTATDAAAAKTAADAAAAAGGAEGGKADDKGKGKDGDGAQAQGTQGAPEKYTVTLPENSTLLDASDLKELEKTARKANWSNDEFQAVLDSQLEALQGQSDRFLTDLKADKDYGGDNFAETQKLAKAVIAKVRPAGHARQASFMAMVNRGGAFNHIEVVSFLADLGRLMAEDGSGSTLPVKGAESGDLGSKLYDHPTSKAADGKS